MVVGLVVECAVCDDEVGWDVGLQLAGFLQFLLLGYHYQRQLARRLPVLVLLCDFLGIERDLSALLVVGFGALCVVDLVLRDAGVNAKFTLGFVDVVGLDVKLCLCLGEGLSILVLLEADVLLLLLFLGVLGCAFDHRFGVGSSVYLWIKTSRQVFLWLFVQIDLGVPIEFTHNASLLIFFLFIIIVDVRILFPLLIGRLFLFLRVISINASTQFGLSLDYAIRGKLLYQVLLSNTIEVRMFQGFESSQSITGLHFQKLFEEVEAFWREFAEVTLVNGLQVMDLREFHAEIAWILQESFIVI